MKSRTTGLVALFSCLVACGTLEKKTIQISPGDDKQAVLKVMGVPDDRQFQAKLEAWQYCVTGAGFGWNDYRVIWFEEGRVTGITSYKGGAPGASCMAGFQPIRWEHAPDQIIETRRR